jgi:hypothetical protein
MKINDINATNAKNGIMRLAFIKCFPAVIEWNYELVKTKEEAAKAWGNTEKAEQDEKEKAISLYKGITNNAKQIIGSNLLSIHHSEQYVKDENVKSVVTFVQTKYPLLASQITFLHAKINLSVLCLPAEEKKLIKKVWRGIEWYEEVVKNHNY